MEGLVSDLNKLILLDLQYPDNVNLCLIDKRWNKFCQNEDVWKYFLNRDFPGLNSKPYKQIYLRNWNIIDNFVNEILDKITLKFKHLDRIILRKNIIADILEFLLNKWDSLSYDIDDSDEFQSMLIDKYLLSPRKAGIVDIDRGIEHLMLSDELPIKNLLDNLGFVGIEDKDIGEDE